MVLTKVVEVTASGVMVIVVVEADPQVVMVELTVLFFVLVCVGSGETLDGTARSLEMQVCVLATDVDTFRSSLGAALATASRKADKSAVSCMAIGR